MRRITYKKSFRDKMLERVFVQKASASIANNIETDLSNDMKRAQKSICVVFDRFFNDRFLPLFLDSDAPKYVIVPEISEEKYQRLIGKAVIHEVPDIKGNYCLIDDEILYLFDPESFVGVRVTEGDIVRVVKNLFQNEFWVHTENEFIEKKLPMAEISFDIPPVYGNDNILLDVSFGDETPVQQLLKNAKMAAFTGKMDSATSTDVVILKDIQQNQGFLKTIDGGSVLLCPQLPFSVLHDGKDWYACSFDLEAYERLQNARDGRLFALKVNGFGLGETYSFEREKGLEELVGKKVLSMKGDEITVYDCIEESRSVTVDLRIARDLQNADEETLEARLEKLQSNIFNTNDIACSAVYHIELVVPQHRFSKKATVYQEYQNAIQAVNSKIQELLRIESNWLNDKLRKRLLEASDMITSIKDREMCARVEALVEIVIDLMNENVPKDAKKIAPLKRFNLSMNLPQYGTLYQDKHKYEYVLTDEEQLDRAIGEMAEAGIPSSDISYLLQ